MKSINPTLMMKYNALFLDFDGVVVESTNIKTEAFYELYLPYGTSVAENAMAYHLQHQGVPRSKKFIDIHQYILDKDLSDSEIKNLSKRFSQLVLEKILICPLVEGVIEFLERCIKDKVQVFLLSATPDEELNLILAKRDLKKYFQEAYGHPFSKESAGQNILAAYGLNPSSVLFIGDSLSDYNAAKTLNTRFIGRLIKGFPSLFPGSVKAIYNFYELL